jgi:N-acetylglucosamine-6-phosphate deacetylase
MEFITALVERGVTVSLGHTDGTAAMASDAFGAGATGVTHLFNAMSPMTAREPGVVGASLNNKSCWCGVIADGHHVSLGTLAVALAARPHSRFMLVSDAMPCVGSDQNHFMLGDRRIEVQDGVCRSADGTLAGSAVGLLTCIRNVAGHLVPLATAFRMASEYPADFLGLGATHGRIAPGYRADLLAVAPTLDAAEVIG